MNNSNSSFSRREFARRIAFGAATLSVGGVFSGIFDNARAAVGNGPDHWTIPLNQDWLFGGKFNAATLEAQNDHGFAPITLPHCVTKLSWENWDHKSWESIWIYRRHLTAPKREGKHRVFIKFDGVMAG